MLQVSPLLAVNLSNEKPTLCYVCLKMMFRRLPSEAGGPYRGL